jgi:hypothetical protein
MVAAVCLAACGASSSVSGSTVKSVTTVSAPDTVEVADAAKRSTDATTASHPIAPTSHPADRRPVIPVSRPAAPPPAADPDRGTPGFNCQGFSGPGKPKLMCAPQ